jgi:hypothetical protein
MWGSNDLASLAQLDEAGGPKVHVEEPANGLLEWKELISPLLLMEQLM